MKHHLSAHLTIKSHYLLAPTASGDTPSPLRPLFLTCRVDSLTRCTFLLPVKPGWRLNVLVAAMRQRGEGWGRRRRGFRSAWGKGSLLLKESFVAIISPGLACVQTPLKGDIDLSQACRKICMPAKVAGSHRNGFIRRQKWWKLF